MNVRPLASALGAEVTGVDLTEVSRETFDAILNAWSRYLVLVFPRQQLTDEQLAAFSRHFGQLDMAPPVEATRVDGYSDSRLPEVTVISNVIVNGKPIGALGAGEAEWHTDMLFKTTTLAYVIGIIEFFHAATIVNSRELIPYTTYAMLAIVYFVCCYVIAVIVRRLDPKYVLRSA